MRNSLTWFTAPALYFAACAVPGLCYVAHAAYGQQTSDQTIPTRIVKIPIHFARASDISEMLGGMVISMTTGRPRTDSTSPLWMGWQSGMIANLLPEGIQSVTALEVDNTLIVRYDTDDALRELRYTVNLLDKKARSVSVRARALIIITDARGHTRRLELTSQGTTTDQRALHLKSTIEPAAERLAGAELVSATSDADVFARLIEDGAADVSTDWYLNLEWRVPGKSRPLRFKNIFRTDSFIPKGQAFTVTRASLPLPTGMAEILLEIKPTEAVVSGGASAPAAGTGREIR